MQCHHKLIAVGFTLLKVFCSTNFKTWKVRNLLPQLFDCLTVCLLFRSHPGLKARQPAVAYHGDMIIRYHQQTWAFASSAMMRNDVQCLNSLSGHIWTIWLILAKYGSKPPENAGFHTKNPHKIMDILMFPEIRERFRRCPQSLSRASLPRPYSAKSTSPHFEGNPSAQGGLSATHGNMQRSNVDVILAWVVLGVKL